MRKHFLTGLLVFSILFSACQTSGEDLQGKFSTKTKTALKVTAPSTLTDQDAYVGQSDVHIGDFYAKAIGQDFEIDKITFQITDTNAADSVHSVGLKYPTDLSAPTVLDGYAVSTPAGTTIMFDELGMMVPKGSSGVTMEVYIDVDSLSDLGDAIALKTKGDFEAVSQTSGDTYHDKSVIDTSATTGTVTIK